MYSKLLTMIENGIPDSRNYFSKTLQFNDNLYTDDDVILRV